MNPTPTDWQEFFDLQAPVYDQNEFTQNTDVEVQFLISQLGLEPGMRILDLGCGTGRHCVAFAARGFQVTGVDFSTQMIVECKRKASTVEWVLGDVCDFRIPLLRGGGRSAEGRTGGGVAESSSPRPLPSSSPTGSPSPEEGDLFDAVLCLCESPINLLPPGKEPIQHALDILRTMEQCLKPGGKSAFTALNAYAQIRQMQDEHVEAHAFDPVSMMSQYLSDMELPTGPATVLIRERLFIPPEIIALLHTVGLRPERVYGGTAGEWGERPLKLDEVEALYIASRP